MWYLLFIGSSPVSKLAPESTTLFMLHWHFGLVMIYEFLRVGDIYDLSFNIHHSSWCNALSFIAIDPYRYYNTLLFMCTQDRSCVVSNPFIFLTPSPKSVSGVKDTCSSHTDTQSHLHRYSELNLQR
jgi:hypothetical protein